MGQVIVYIAFTNMENGKIKEFQKEDAVGAVTVGPSSCLEQGTSKAEPSPLIPDKPGILFSTQQLMHNPPSVLQSDMGFTLPYISTSYTLSLFYAWSLFHTL